MNALEALQAYSMIAGVELAEAFNELRYRIDAAAREYPRNTEIQRATIAAFGAFYNPSIHGPVKPPKHVVAQSTPTPVIPVTETVRTAPGHVLAAAMEAISEPDPWVGLVGKHELGEAGA